MTRAPLKDLRQSQRTLRASITTLRRAIHRARYKDALESEVAKLEKSVAELGRRIAAEQAALDEPHAFVRRFGIWCLRCGAKRELLSVLDYHPAGEKGAGWGRHRGVYPCPVSEAWKAWGGVSGLALSQEQFAELLDTRDAELIAGTFKAGALAGKTAPPPSDLVTLAQTLETYCTSNAKRERDPSGRAKLTFLEESGIKATVAPPAAFLIRIRVFEDAQPVELEVRLRVTVEGTAARFHVRIHDAAEVLAQTFEFVCGQVADETKLPVFIGTPE